MHITSLPSRGGIGTFGEAAYRFVDFLAQAGQRFWQILPLGPTGCGDSPYQSCSTFAGNPYLIDLDFLCGQGLLLPEEYEPLALGTDPSRVDYDRLRSHRIRVLRKACGRVDEAWGRKAEEFMARQAFWLEDYALYMALKTQFDECPWTRWPEEIRLRYPEAVCRYTQSLHEEIRFWKLVQYLFFEQWFALKRYANEHGIFVIGDLPIYVAPDSADVWASPELFELDAELRPVAVAGCPPDAFSATGQLWGNPLYRWEHMKQDGYAWWAQRLRAAAVMFDTVRIDHFRGFDSYYVIPAGDATAENGQWRPGPGFAFFQAMQDALGPVRVIAEDLGMLTESVHELRRETGFPGMKVLQFAFDPWGQSTYLPHNHEQNCVAYTGTHDNDTSRGWFENAPQAERDFCGRYLNMRADDSPAYALIRAAWASVADTAIAPMQDFLELGSQARMNTPSTVGGNWQWRMLPDSPTPELAGQIYDLTALYGRLGQPTANR